MILKIGTRGSPLALWQAEWVRRALEEAHRGLETELVKIRTLAERFPEKQVPEIGTGIFTRELDEALLRGEIDLAVHSLKDVPSEMDPQLILGAVPERESPFDAFVSPDRVPLAELPRAARIGTGSPRRKAQLLFRRPDLIVEALRGNVQTRLRKMKELGLQGTVLAHAGLKRLEDEKQITEILPPEVLVPAVSQGALGIVTRLGDDQVRSTVGALDHAPSRLRVTAERAFLRRLRGGCQVPAGALASLEGEGLKILGVVAAPDGSACVRHRVSGSSSEAESLGSRLAEEILELGGAAILDSLRRS